MIKGAVKPASTHTATMAIRFGTTMPPRDFSSSMRKMRKPYRLKVRFYSGVNLNSYANQKVQVIVKVPGCRLPDEVGAEQIYQKLQELETISTGSKSPQSQMRQLKLKADSLADYDEALTVFSEARSLLARAEDAMQHAVQAEQQKSAELRRELTEAKEAQRKAVSELSAARDAQEKAEGRLEKLEEKLQAKRDAIQELQDEKEQLEAKLDKKKKENRDLKEEVEELEEKVQKGKADEKKKQRSHSSGSGDEKPKKSQVSQVKAKSASRSGSRGSRGANGAMSPERELPKKEERKSKSRGKSRGKSSSSSKGGGRKDRSRHSSRERSRRDARRRRSRSRGRSSSHRSRSRYRGKGDGKGEGQLCIPFVQGRCRRGDTCRDRHPTDDVDSIYDQLQRKPCRYGADCKRRDCAFRNAPKEASGAANLHGVALKEHDPSPEHFNTNLLSFPGEVDSAGVLHFTENDQRVRWVERATPSNWPLEVSPHTQFADFYVIAVGHETEPPQVFGHLRLQQKSLDEVVPKWKQLSFDTSVVAASSAYYKSNLAGFILGAASLTPATGSKPRKNSLSSWNFWSAAAPSLPSGHRRMCCSSSKKQVFEAFSGEDVRYEVQVPAQRKTVYCHVDLLAARELPAMDDDGLVDPSYSIEVKDQALLYPSGIMKSLSPSFMHRIKIPIEMEVEPEPTKGLPMMASAIPFPPIIVKILDRDERKVLGVDAGETFEEVGRVVIKPSMARSYNVGRNGEQTAEVYPLLGFVQEEESYVVGTRGSLFASKMPKDLDLNRLHVAKWYALDKAAEAAFDTSMGGEEDSWRKRPRVLAAANYSFQANIREGLTQGPNLAKGAARGISIHQLHTHQSASFKIDFCLLGLRNLPWTMVDCKLYVSSFWEGGAIELAIGAGLPSIRNFNFMVEDASEGWRSHLSQWKPLLRIDDEQNQEKESTLWTVKLKDLTGLKIQPPMYEVPVIPYLQQDKLKPGRWSLHDLDSGEEFDVLVRYEGTQAVEVQKFANGQLEEVRHPGHFNSSKQVIRFTLEDTEWSGQVTSFGSAMPLLRVADLKDMTRTSRFFTGTWHEEDPFVLLPSLTIQLKNPSTGADHGTLTVGLNQLGTTPSSWMQICSQELSQLPQELHQWSCKSKGEVRTGAIQPLRGIKYMDEAYDTFVDVFASRSGFVDFAVGDLFISRTLQDNCLFKICPSRDKEDDTEDDGSVTQFFNTFDWVAGDSRRLSEAFDERFWPRLCCGPNEKEPILEELPPIPEHCLPEDVDRIIGKILDWMDAKENAINHTMPRSSHPLGPTKMFEKFFQIPKVAAFAKLKKQDLETMSTTQIHRKLRKVGWRFSTHLAAPELVPLPSRSVLKFFTDSQLHVNRHTFMVQVGHQIGKDRDSRILCRLRMDLPRNFLEPMRKVLMDCRQLLERQDEDQTKVSRSTFLDRLTHSGGVVSQTIRTLQNIVERLKRVEAGTSNYFMVKFKQPGVVVWAAPEQQKAWDRPGTLLFAVKLFHQPDVVVPVVVAGRQKKPDVEHQVAWNTGIAACAKGPKRSAWQSAVQLFDATGRQRLESDIVTYNACLSAYAQAEHWKAVLQLCANIAKDSLRKSVISYGVAIKAGHWRYSQQMLRHLKEESCEANVILYNSVMAESSWRSAEGLLAQMSNEGCSATVISYNVLLHHGSQRGAWDRAIHVVQQLRRGLQPSSSTFNSAMASSVWQVALIFLASLQVLALQPSDATGPAIAVTASRFWQSALAMKDVRLQPIFTLEDASCWQHVLQAMATGSTGGNGMSLE
eukprot:symbB.v1.2.014582.t1/scaffold1069.1/size140053/6